MQLHDLAGRVQRLAQQGAGFSRELDLWRKRQDPMRAAEKREYLDALGEAVRGVVLSA